MNLNASILSPREERVGRKLETGTSETNAPPHPDLLLHRMEESEKTESDL